MPSLRLLAAAVLMIFLSHLEQASCFSSMMIQRGHVGVRVLHDGALQIDNDVVSTTGTRMGYTTEQQHKEVRVNKLKERPPKSPSLLRSDKEKETTTTTTTTQLPPVIQQIADERQEFQINLGRAMDTLRLDIPDILRTQPDFSIYHSDISLIDPSGVQLTGLDKYKSALQFLQSFIQFWFVSNSSGLQYRMVYDFCRSSIRISWNVRLVPKFVGRPVYIDGISLYKLDSQSGKIIQHKIEKLIINNTPVTPPYGIFSLLLQHEGAVVQPVPVGLAAAGGSSFSTLRYR